MADPWYKLLEAFSDPDRNLRQTIYVYRVGRSGEAQKPYMLKACGMFFGDTELLYHLQRAYGEGAYRILIRDGSAMVFSGEIAIGPAPTR